MRAMSRGMEIGKGQTSEIRVNIEWKWIIVGFCGTVQRHQEVKKKGCYLAGCKGIRTESDGNRGVEDKRRSVKKGEGSKYPFRLLSSLCRLKLKAVLLF